MKTKIASILSFLAALVMAAANSSSPPNIVLILADDLGYGDVSIYGAPDINTPSIDHLAKQGAKFTDGYAAFPVCSPSRAALLTGHYMQRYGSEYEDYFGGGTKGLIPDVHLTLGNLLKDAGYTTGVFGKWNVSHAGRIPPNAFGFDRWVGLHLNHDFYTHRLIGNDELDMYEDGESTEKYRGTWSDTVFADEAIRFIKEAGDQPFFVYLPFQAPHDPIQDVDIPFDEPKRNLAKHRDLYVKMVEQMDHEIRRVMIALSEQGVADNTLVIVTSDNGAPPNIGRNLPLRDTKQTLWEGGIRVPLVVRWPGVVEPGRIIDTPVIAMDLSATIAAAAGAVVPPEAEMDGADLTALLAGTGDLPEDRPLFWRRKTINVRKGLDSIRQSAVRQGDWKYVRSYQYLGGQRFGEDFNEGLFNLSEDIGETNNRAPSNPEKLQHLQRLLNEWEAEMADSVRSEWSTR